VTTQDYIGRLLSIIDFQAGNGLLTADEAKHLQHMLSGATAALSEKKEDRAQILAHGVFIDLIERLNNKPLNRRLCYLWGAHIWAFLVALSVVLILLIVQGTLTKPVLLDVPGEIVAWGGLGGCAYAIYYVRKSVYQFLLSKYYAVYWFVYPFAGMIFGMGTVLLVTSGLIALQAKPSYLVYASLAFLGGMFQQWAIQTLSDVAHAIHPPKAET
jgi:hypothetical protein